MHAFPHILAFTGLPMPYAVTRTRVNPLAHTQRYIVNRCRHYATYGLPFWGYTSRAHNGGEFGNQVLVKLGPEDNSSGLSGSVVTRLLCIRS